MLAPGIPLYQRVISGTFAFAFSIGTIDGLVDIVKGTHHHFDMVLLKHAATIIGNKPLAQKIEYRLDYILEHREAGYRRKE